MSLLKFIFDALGALKDPKAIGVIMLMTGVMLVAWGGGGYYVINKVEAKHLQAMIKISKNKDRFMQLLVVQEKILVKLDAIKEGIDDTKGHVKTIGDRVWQIGRRNRGR